MSATRPGFTLVEVLVAFVILAAGLGVLTQTLALSVRTSDRLIEKQAVLELGASLLERVGSDIKVVASDNHGESLDGHLSWHLTMRPTKILEIEEARQQGLYPYRIEIEIMDETNGRSLLILKTLRLGEPFEDRSS